MAQPIQTSIGPRLFGGLGRDFPGDGVKIMGGIGLIFLRFSMTRCQSFGALSIIGPLCFYFLLFIIGRRILCESGFLFGDFNAYLVCDKTIP